jgi:hypothetical protein
MKQRTKRALLMLMSVMSLAFANAETIVTVGGLSYSLNGAYASVYYVASGNTSETITVPATFTYEGLMYTVNDICSHAFYWATSYSTSYREHVTRNQYVKHVILPNTIKTIGAYAFSNSNITKVELQEGVEEIENDAFSYSAIIEIVIPTSTKRFWRNNHPFSNCNKLRTIYYLGSTPPSNWVSTSHTYVPNKKNYGTPYYSINSANVTEMISSSESTFAYTGKVPEPTWTNNVAGYSVFFVKPKLKSEVGNYEEIIPFTFMGSEMSFTADIPYQYTITPVTLTVKANNVSRAYGEKNPELKINYSGFINGENENTLATKPTISTTATESSPIGTYPITVSGGSSAHYQIEYEQGQLTVNKAPLSIRVKDEKRMYGSSNPSFSVSYSGLKNGQTVPEWVTSPTFTTTATKVSNAGAYPINVTCEPKNYTIASNITGTLTVTKAPLTVKVANAKMDYCGTWPKFSFTYSGFLNGDDASVITAEPTIATDATMTSNAGTYTITPQGGVANNYDFNYTSGTLTIAQRPLTVKANSASRLYGEENPELDVEYSGFVNNESKAVLDVEPIVSTTASIRSQAGTYDIRVSGGQAKNYYLSYLPGYLTINPRALKASVGNYSRPYGQNNPAFSIIYEGLIGNDTESSLSSRPMIRTSATKDSNVGTYDLQVTGGYSPNYTFSYGSGKLTIVKAEQDFSWNQDLNNLKVGDQVLLEANATSGLPITYTMDPNDNAEIYSAGSKTFLDCKSPGKFYIKATQNGNDNYYSTQRINKGATIFSENTYKPTLYVKQADNGMISMKVEKGSKQTFTIHAEKGWKIHSLTFNDVDVTNDLDENDSYTTPSITESSTLYVIYENDGNNAVYAPRSSSVKIQGTERGVRVTGAVIGETIRVYTENGKMQQSLRVSDTITDIILPKDNVYIIKVEDKVLKLLH